MNASPITKSSNRAAFARPLRNATILAAFLSAVAAVPAGASESNGGPIEVRSCSAVYAPAAEQPYALGLETVAGVQIDFINRSEVPAEDVTFQLGTDNAAATVVDHGSFAPGALIHHVFWTGAGVDASACRVAAVRFTGGSAYTASASTDANR